jgi:very-short-patch-repair endonuclease
MKGQTNQAILRPRLQRRLRKEPTDAERRLWQVLRNRQLEGCKFRRQHPFGDYILDFACLERMLVVECDGGQHADAVERDAERTRQLELAGFMVLRYWNNEVLGNLEGVAESIRLQLLARAGLASRADTIPTQPSP